jgi:hypothetical protein
MAYDTLQLFNSALEIISNDPDLVFEYEVAAELGIGISTFYDHFPSDSEESKSIKEALRNNKAAIKREMRKKWRDSDNATLQVANYKLLSDKEEHSRLTRSEIDHTSKDKPISINPITWVESDNDSDNESDQD